MNTRSFRAADAVRLLLAAALLPLLAGCLSIHKVADKGNLTAVKQYLKAGVAVDARDRQGRTPLMYMLTDRDAVRYLVEQGADVNARDDKGETPLMKAAFLGHLDVVEFLVERGADVNARSAAGETPLMRATRSLDVVKYLVEHGADVNARDAHGDTLLLKEAVSGRLNIVQYLLKVGATVDVGAPAAAP